MYSLYLLLFLLPFSIAVVESTFGILLITWLIQRADPRTRGESLWSEPSHRPLSLAALVFFGACALSIATSDNRVLSLRALFYKWAEYLLFWVIVADVAHRPGVARRAVQVIAVGAVFVILEGLWQEWTGAGLFRGSHNPRINVFNRMTGPYQNPIDLAMYIMMTILPLIMLANCMKGPYRRLVWVVVGGLVMCLARTWAFGSILALCFGLFVIILCEPALRRLGLLLLSSVLAASAVALYKAGYLGDTLSTSELSKHDRLMVWQAGWHMFKDRPLLGHGLNTFMSNYLRYWVGGEQMPRYAHNCYLQMAAETGVVGLAAFMAMLGALMWHLVRRVRALDGEQRLLVLGFIASLAGFLSQATIDTNFYSVRQVALFFTYAGLATGCAAPHRA